jgi:hypothetical protein
VEKEKIRIRDEYVATKIRWQRIDVKQSTCSDVLFNSVIDGGQGA